LACSGVLESQCIPIGMDDKGGWRDKVFVERLWRSIKYAELGYENVIAVKACITRYPGCYNCRPPQLRHQCAVIGIRAHTALWVVGANKPSPQSCPRSQFWRAPRHVPPFVRA
jgi:hypothetical protein